MPRVVNIEVSVLSKNAVSVVSEMPHPLDGRLDVFARISQAIETAATLEELVLLSLYELTQYLQLHGGIVALLDEQHALQITGRYPPQANSTMTMPLDHLPLIRQSMRQREVVMAQLLDDEISQPYQHLLQDKSAHEALIIPLIAQDNPMGIMLLYSQDGAHQFSSSDMQLARVLISQIATAIASLRLHESAYRRNAELATLNEIANAITSSLDTHEVYRLVVQKLSAHFRVEAGSLLMLDERTGDLRFVMTIEGAEERLAGISVPAGEGVVGHVVQTRQWAIVHDVATDARFYKKVSEDLGFVTRSILCVPMIAKGRIIGVIELLNKLNGHFDEDEAERLTRMAAFIGVAIENARLFQQVADGRDLLSIILNSTADGILMSDTNGTILMANSMAARIIDKQEQDLIGSKLDNELQRLGQRAQEVVTRQRANANDQNTNAAQDIYEYHFSQGPYYHIRVLHLPVYDAGSVMYGQLTVLRDFTQEHELEQLRDDYTNMLIHDLRAPLTSIMNGIMMVQRQLVGPLNEQQIELLKIAYLGSTTMLTLINNLLDISKMEQGRLILDIKPLVPYAIVDQVIERLKALIQNSPITLKQRLLAHLPLVEADEDKIIRVLQNLLDNAIKFSPNGETVILGVAFKDDVHSLPEDIQFKTPIPAGSWMIFWVQDHGRGIPSAYHLRIFEKFGQVLGQKIRGTGLGLSFCKLAVEAHQGRLWVESEEGQGSTFIFILPLGK